MILSILTETAADLETGFPKKSLLIAFGLKSPIRQRKS